MKAFSFDALLITGRKSVKKHFQNFHKETDPFPGGIRKSLHESVKVIAGEYYSCKIEGCERRAIKTFYDDINQHLLRVHKMSMFQYHDSFEKKRPEARFLGSTKPNKEDVKKNESQFKDKKKRGKMSVSNRKINKILNYKKRYGKLIEWIDSSVFKCEICASKLSGRRAVRKHFSMVHSHNKLFSMSNGEN